MVQNPALLLLNKANLVGDSASWSLTQLACKQLTVAPTLEGYSEEWMSDHWSNGWHRADPGQIQAAHLLWTECLCPCQTHTMKPEPPVCLGTLCK